MAKPKKLPSGNWTIRLYDYTDENGKKIYKSITKENKNDVMYHAGLFLKEKKANKKKAPELTVRNVVDKYIELSAGLSPTTTTSYKLALEHAFTSLMGMPVSELTDEIVQIAINEESKRIREHRKSANAKNENPDAEEKKTGKTISAKTVKNEWGIIAAALYSICKLRFNVKLPKKQKHIKYYPDPKKVLNAIIGSEIELPCLLAIWLSFSMSEIRGLKYSDIKDGYITINRVMVDVENVPTIKDNAKVETRLRRHKIPPYIKKLIESDKSYQEYQKTKTDGFLVPLSHSEIYGRWKKICQANDFELTFHDLRHLNASIMLMLNIPEKYAMERGGWKTPTVMKEVYQHTFTAERQIVDDKIDSYFDSLLNK